MNYTSYVNICVSQFCQVFINCYQIFMNLYSKCSMYNNYTMIESCFKKNCILNSFLEYIFNNTIICKYYFMF